MQTVRPPAVRGLSSLLLLVSLSIGGGRIDAQTASDILPYRHEIIDRCLLANDYWIANNGPENAPSETNNWDGAAYYTGNQRLIEVLSRSIPAEAAERTRYLNRALAWSIGHDWEHGPKGPLDPDSHTCGQTYIDLYQLDPQPVRLAGVDGVTGIKPTIDDIYDEGTASDGDWSWIDTFYMAAPVFARLDQTVGETEGRDYSAKLRTMYLDMRDQRDLFDESDGLWYRDANAKNVTTQNGEKEFWARGNGWVIGGLVRVMEQLGPAHPDHALYATMLQTMGSALIPLQQADGFWRASLADPADTRWDNPETSGTAFITYAMAWGINNGVLDAATYEPVVAKAWNGMVQTALHPDGKVGYVQTVARAPGPAYYEDTRNYAVGAFMLAGSELSLMAPVPPLTPSAGVDQTWTDFDGNGTVQVTLDASDTLDPNHKAVTFEWLEGTTPVASGTTADVVLPVGVHDITLRITDDDTNTWEDSVRITIGTAAAQQILLDSFENAGGDAPLSTFGWSVLLTEDGLISDYGTQSRAIGVASGDYAFFAPKADDNTSQGWTALVPNEPALASTALPETMDISSLTSVHWIASGDNADHEYRLAVQVGGQWYASYPALNDGVPDSGPSTFTPLSFEPASFATASNWRLVENATPGASTPLSLGAQPASDLSGLVTRIGFFLVPGTDDESAGDHVRFDSFEVIAQASPAPRPPTLSTFSRVSGNQWELILEGTPNTDFQFFSSPDLAFDPGTLLTTLTQADPATDRGTASGGSILTTDDTGRAEVRLTLIGRAADFVRAVQAP